MVASRSGPAAEPALEAGAEAGVEPGVEPAVEPPTRARLLELWERGRAAHPVDRALLLLGAAFPDAPYERLARLTIGQRDAALLSLRRAAFGPHLEGYVDCPRCGERLAFAIEARALALQPATSEPASRTIETAGGLRFRLPSSRDLARVAAEEAEEAAADARRSGGGAAARLAELCFLGPGGRDTLARELAHGEAALLAEVEARMAEADPQADVVLDFACGACGESWRAPFDIVAFLWEEVEARALRLLRDVHLLARSYGWPERDILALSDARRALYLEMAGA
jgi:hypothetical protein